MIRVTDTEHGHMMYEDRDKWIGRSFHVLGEYGREESEAICAYVREGTCAIDVGANIGAITVEMSRALNNGIVLAIEPQYRVWQMLVGNCALNECTNVLPLNAAAGDAIGTITVPDVMDIPTREINVGGMSLACEPHKNGKPCKLLTIDSLIKTDAEVSVIKIDVEGMEPAVLRGAEATIARCKPAVYFEIDRDNWAESVAFLMKRGYRCFAHNPPLFRPNNYRDTIENPWQGWIISANCIAVHPDVGPMPPDKGYLEIIQERKGATNG